MVHPYLRHSGCVASESFTSVTNSSFLFITRSLDHSVNDNKALTQTIDKIVERVAGILPRLHVLVVGPGLSRDDVMVETTKKIMNEAKEKRMSMVIDAV